MATIPDCRDMLTVRAQRLRKPFLSLAERQRIADEIDAIVAEMYRRPAVRKARRKARHMTEAMKRQARKLAARHPDMPIREIGQRIGVDGGRVSEAVAGFRR